MALIDRIFHDDPDRTRHISNHKWSAALYFWAKGEFTRAEIVTMFSLTAEDEVQLDQLVAFYTGLSTAEKQEFHSRVESAGVLAETGEITKAKYVSLLGMT